MDYTILMSILSVVVLIGVGNKKRWAWCIGLISQCLWFYFIYDYKAYGLIPMHIVYTILYVRNLIKWR